MMNRRTAIKSAAALSLAAPVLSIAQATGGRLKQGVSLWCWTKWFDLDALCVEAKRIGLQGIDLVTPDQYATVNKHGLINSMTMGTAPNTIPVGLNRLENHDKVLESLKRDITLAAEAKCPNVITFSGNRKGMPDGEGLTNCAIGLNKIKGYARGMLSALQLGLRAADVLCGMWWRTGCVRGERCNGITIIRCFSYST